MKKSFILTDFVGGRNNNKFWNVIVNGTQVATEYGRVGERPQKTVKDFTSERAADTFASKKISEKKEKGYSEIEIVADSD